MKREISRIKAMIILYSYDLTGEIISYDFLDEDDIECDDDFTNELIKGVMENRHEIDKIININLKNYSLDRLSYVDRNIVRIATYEMKYTATPHPIIINNALDITHEYSELDDEKQSKFNNALLDNISKWITNGK